MSIRTAFVTGAGGFIGSTLVRRLLSRGVATSALVRGESEASRLDREGAEVLRMVDASGGELNDLLRGRAFDAVFHLAAAGVRGGVDDAEIINGNVMLTSRLLSALADRTPGVFIQTGSCFEYGDAGGEVLAETTPANPRSVYAAAKLAAFFCGRALAAKSGIRFVNLRLFCVHGPGEGPSRLIPYVVERLSRDQPVDLSGGEQSRDFVHVDDVVDALLAAADARELEHDLYNVCTGRGTRVRDVVELVARLMDKPTSLLEWGRRPYRPDDAGRMVGCHLRITAETGWAPSIPLEQGIADMVFTIRSDRDIDPADSLARAC